MTAGLMTPLDAIFSNGILYSLSQNAIQAEGLRLTAFE